MPDEIARFACTCRFARDCMKTYSDSWIAKLEALAVEHRMKIKRNLDGDTDDLDRFYFIDYN